VQEAVRTDGGAKSLVLPGDRFRAGRSTSITILAPSVAQKSRTADDQTVVARIDNSGFRTLLMSDAGAAAEEHLLRNAPAELRADILVLGRHGTDIFATADFLAAVQPRIIILAAADPFRHGQDEENLRARLAATGAEIFAQDECGAVIVTFTSDRAEVRGFLGNHRTVLAPP